MEKVVLHALARSIFEQVLADCSIEHAFAQKVHSAPNESSASRLLFGSHAVDFSAVEHLRIVAVGKASKNMLDSVLSRLPYIPTYDIAGIVIGPESLSPISGFQSFQGGHPFPNEASFAGARATLSLLRDLPPDASTANSLCLFLISGGASAMMELPLDPTITLEETIMFHRILVHSGASIGEINCIRKHFSAVKGGRLALAAKNASCLSILVSDVPPGHLDSIASGPTLPDTSTIDECREILARYQLLDQFPLSVRQFFISKVPETAKPGDIAGHTWTLLDTHDLADAARRRAEKLGFYTIVDNTCDDWDYRDAAEYLLDRLRFLKQNRKRVCLISAGEVLVQPASAAGHSMVITSGNGGRNQHFALYAAMLIKDSAIPIAVLSAGSDGIDGHSNAAGAVVDETSLRTREDGHAVDDDLLARAELALLEFHSSTFLDSIGRTIVTGPTGNNLRDLRILMSET